MSGWHANSDLEGIELASDREATDDGPWPEEECGRWRNGTLARIAECLSAGTEFCQIECPMMLGER